MHAPSMQAVNSGGTPDWGPSPPTPCTPPASCKASAPRTRTAQLTQNLLDLQYGPDPRPRPGPGAPGNNLLWPLHGNQLHPGSPFISCTKEVCAQGKVFRRERISRHGSLNLWFCFGDLFIIWFRVISIQTDGRGARGGCDSAHRHVAGFFASWGDPATPSRYPQHPLLPFLSFLFHKELESPTHQGGTMSPAKGGAGGRTPGSSFIKKKATEMTPSNILLLETRNVFASLV